MVCPLSPFRDGMGRPPLPPIRPGLVAAQQSIIDGQCITVSIFARYPDAVADRDVPVSVRLDLAAYPEAREQFREVLDYGIGFQSPYGAASGTVGLPGGFGGSYEYGTVKLGANHAPGTQPFRVRLRVLDEDRTELAVTHVNMEASTVGLTGTNVRSIGREEHGAFALELQLSATDGTMNVRFEPLDLAGTTPGKVRTGVAFASYLHAPHWFQVLPEFGRPGPERTSVPQTWPWSNEAKRLVVILDALATIQDHTHVEIRTPDLTTTSINAAREWLRAAKLLRGEQVRAQWAGPLNVRAHSMNENYLADFEPQPITLRLPHRVAIDAAELDLGRIIMQTSAAQIISIYSDVSTRQITATYEPANSEHATIYMSAEVESA